MYLCIECICTGPICIYMSFSNTIRDIVIFRDRLSVGCIHVIVVTPPLVLAMLSIVTFTCIILPIAFPWKFFSIPLEAVLHGIGWWSSPAPVPEMDMTHKVVIVTGANTGERGKADRSRMVRLFVV